MKKILSIILAALLALGIFSAMAEEGNAPEMTAVPPLQGTVLELNEDGFLLETADIGNVLVLTHEETVLEGLSEVVPGEYVLAYYNGMMTRSLPPQVNAEKIAQYALMGIVAEVTEEGIVLEQYDENAGRVTVTLPEGAPRLFVGCPVTVYTDGVMTASLDPLVNAAHVRAETICGEIMAVSEGSITLADDQGIEYVVNLAEETVLEIEPAEGVRAVVYHTGAMTFSLPAQVAAIAVIAEEPTE